MAKPCNIEVEVEVNSKFYIIYNIPKVRITLGCEFNYFFLLIAF